MRFNLIFLVLLCSGSIGLSQNTKDVEFLKSMAYLKDNKLIDCNNQEGSSLESRICLNLNVQKNDSIMLAKFNALLLKIDKNETKETLIKQQHHWEQKRKELSIINSDGFQGHYLGIQYLYIFNELTKLRLKELELILPNKY